MFEGVDVDDISLDIFMRELEYAASYAHFVVKEILIKKGVLSVSFFKDRSIDGYEGEINSWLKEYKINNIFDINKEELTLKDGKILLSSFEKDLVVYSNILQKIINYLKDNNERVNENLSGFYIEEDILETK